MSLFLYAEDSIQIITEEWPPYNYLEGNRVTGFSTEVVESILNLMEEDYEIQILPSMRATILLENQPGTMMYSMFRTPERESKYQWIGPISSGSISFYKRKDDQRVYTGIEDLKEVDVIACRNGGLVYNLLKKEGYTNLDTTSADSLSIYRKLLYGRCDLAISDTDLGVRHLLNSQGLKLDDVFEKVPVPVVESDLYIACSPDIPEDTIKKWQAAGYHKRKWSLRKHFE